MILSVIFVLMRQRPPRSTRTDTLFPYTTLFRSDPRAIPSAFLRDNWSLRLAASALILSRVTRLLLSNRCSQYRARSEEHTSELQSPMRISYGVLCLKKTKGFMWDTHEDIHVESVGLGNN